MENKGSTSKGIPIMEPKQWITGLYNSDIMNLLGIPHFSRGRDVKVCVKQLLACVHVGFLWMDRPVSIDVKLIAKLIGLLTDEVKPEKYLDEKIKEKSIVEEVKETFGTDRGNRGMIIRNINDPITRFMKNLMACKLLRKCHK